ncbi:MAG: 16S rRNA (guanine(966)-N(2))-methyltransferase RsmD [Chromatiales bacterium]|jgi:16S rRNA (guanine966-N2)-methyltransferase|nr:MAG: 16S rRNA (guanine(966)-N(2))-methyltransferase RsmD [Chromatiales bacterium]
MRRRQPSPRRSGTPGSVRIIGGRWRGRRIDVVDGAELRPTPDRVRETLFNWLMPVLPGVRCLDLYAGTGVLGLEALSRGAAESWFVERDAGAAAAIEATLQRLNDPGTGSRDGSTDRVLTTDAERWLGKPPLSTFGLVFLDPPYAANNLADLCTLLARGWLAEQATVYLETSRSQSLPVLPEGWHLHRESQAGDVRFALATIRSS